MMLARTAGLRRCAAARPPRSPGPRGRTCPRSSSTSGRPWPALERIGGYMHGLTALRLPAAAPDVAGDGSGRPRAGRRRSPGRSLSTATGGSTRSSWRTFALEDGILQRIDPGLLWVVAAMVLGHVRRGHRGTSGTDGCAGPTRAAGCSRPWPCTCGAATSMAARRPAGRPAVDAHLQRAERAVGCAGAIGQSPTADAFMVGMLLDRGERRARRTAFVELALDRSRVRRRRPALRRGARPRLRRRGGRATRRPSPRLDRTEQMLTSVTTRCGGPGARLRARSSPASAATTRRSRLWSRRSELARQLGRAGAASGATPACWPASWRGSTVGRRCRSPRRPSRCSADRRTGSSSRRALARSCALGCRRRRASRESLLGRALTLPDAAGPPGCVPQVAADADRRRDRRADGAAATVVDPDPDRAPHRAAAADGLPYRTSRSRCS